jgi:hypothetical protein
MKNLIALLFIFIAGQSLFAAGFSQTGSLDIELNNVKRIRINMVGLPKPTVKYVKSEQIARLSFVAIGETQGEASALLSADISFENGDAKVSHYGSYSCEIQKVNGKVTRIKGACYDSAVITLPINSKTEVYSGGDLLTKPFLPMEVIELINKTWGGQDKDKLALVDRFLISYKNAGVKPILTTIQLGLVIHNMTLPEAKLTTLTKLHLAVVEREALPQMIEDEFSYFDREKARKIVGIK